MVEMLEPKPSGESSKQDVFSRATETLLGFTALQPTPDFTIPEGERTPAVSRVIGALLDRTKLLEDELSFDSITGLPNSRVFTRKLESLMAERKAVKDTGGTPPPDTLLYIDINNFKQFNTEFRTQTTTDYLVNAIATTLDKKIKELTVKRMKEAGLTDKDAWDLLARRRQKGDEFMVLMHNCDPETANKFFKEVRDEIAKTVFIVPSQRKAISNISLAHGTYLLDSKPNHKPDKDDSEFIIDQAEKAMYKRKKAMKAEKGTMPHIKNISARDAHDYVLLATGYRLEPNEVMVNENPRGQAPTAAITN